MIYEKFLRPILFRTDPEWIHGVGLAALQQPGLARVLGNFVGPQGHPLRLFNLVFRNRLGLAAGFDKNAEVVPAMYHLGFGFVEVGTVTAHAQPGNPRPRVFRIPESRALVNRLGFPNEGAEAIARRLARLRSDCVFHHYPIGVNIGKSKITPLDQAPDDYLQSFRLVEPHGDFFVVNVSSPNTPDLRKLQSPDHLRDILRPIIEHNRATSGKPLLVKIAPDLQWQEIDEILATIQDLQLDGIVATNTTIARHGVRCNEEGGLSGEPLRERSTEVIRYIVRTTGGRLPVIGVGGVLTRDDYQEKLDAGASLVQTYTGFVYKGPMVVKNLLMHE